MGVDLPRRLNQSGRDFQVVLVRGKPRVLYHVPIDNHILEVSSLNLLTLTEPSPLQRSYIATLDCEAILADAAVQSVVRTM